MPDLYEVLQVSPRAEPEVIRAAYRTLARKYHPDMGGSAARMIALNDAWDVLGDPARRAEYDATRPVAAAGRSASATPASASASTTPAAQGFSSGHAASASATTSPDPAHAGPPPGRPSGTVLDFGRYAGWSLGEIARHDLDYLEWLQRSTFGRRLRLEIDALLRQRRGGVGGPPAGRGWSGRP